VEVEGGKGSGSGAQGRCEARGGGTATWDGVLASVLVPNSRDWGLGGGWKISHRQS
jgi:hypothetical protein